MKPFSTADLLVKVDISRLTSHIASPSGCFETYLEFGNRNSKRNEEIKKLWSEEYGVLKVSKS